MGKYKFELETFTEYEAVNYVLMNNGERNGYRHTPECHTNQRFGKY